MYVCVSSSSSFLFFLFFSSSSVFFVCVHVCVREREGGKKEKKELNGSGRNWLEQQEQVGILAGKFKRRGVPVLLHVNSGTFRPELAAHNGIDYFENCSSWYAHSINPHRKIHPWACASPNPRKRGMGHVAIKI